MSKETALILLGLWVIIMPYLGIYRSWLTVLMVLTGLGFMVIGFLLRGEALSRPSREPNRPDLPFEERAPSAPPHEHEHQEGLTSSH